MDPWAILALLFSFISLLVCGFVYRYFTEIYEKQLDVTDRILEHLFGEKENLTEVLTEDFTEEE
jgi:membrane protein implicated in regulation of membrane protease activity